MRFRGSCPGAVFARSVSSELELIEVALFILGGLLDNVQ